MQQLIKQYDLLRFEIQQCITAIHFTKDLMPKESCKFNYLDNVCTLKLLKLHRIALVHAENRIRIVKQYIKMHNTITNTSNINKLQSNFLKAKLELRNLFNDIQHVKATIAYHINNGYDTAILDNYYECLKFKLTVIHLYISHIKQQTCKIKKQSRNNQQSTINNQK